MAAIDDLKTAWETEIATIGDTLQNAEATYLLDGYIAALQSQASMSANEISSYTIAGRTVTRRNADTGQRLINELRNELSLYVYGNVTQADLNCGTVST